MMDERHQEKAVLRKKLLKELRDQKEEDRLRRSTEIQRKLFALPEFRKARQVLFYASFDGEVETGRMIRQAFGLGKRVALPTIVVKEKKIIPISVDNYEEDLETGPYGIQQPRPTSSRAVSLEEIDLAIVPGVAFDKSCNRLGRGEGYYDRFLKDLPPHIPSVGLAFHFQVVDRLPHREHDVPVSLVLTDLQGHS